MLSQCWTKRGTTLLLLALLCLFLGTAKAQAQLTITLNPATQNRFPGQIASFVGTLTNTTSSELFLNGAGFSFLETGLTGDVNPFFVNAPLSLAAGEVSPEMELFTAAIAPNLSPQTLTGAFFVEGGATENAVVRVGTSGFSVNVVAGAVAAPEPGALTLISLTTLPLFGVWYRRRNAPAA